WRSLRGEYFTLFLEEMARLIHSKGKLFSLGTSRGDYIGFPLGNMKLHWRGWIAKKTIDELHLDEHGWGWGPQGYGYLTDFATSRGLKPSDVALREDYSPLCRKYGVKLYFKCRASKPRAITDECCGGRATPHAIVTPTGLVRAPVSHARSGRRAPESAPQAIRRTHEEHFPGHCGSGLLHRLPAERRAHRPGERR